LAISWVSGTGPNQSLADNSAFRLHVARNSVSAFKRRRYSLGIACRHSPEQFCRIRLNAPPECLSLESPAKSGGLTDSRAEPEIVPVEIVEVSATRQSPMRAGSMERSGQFRVVLAHGLGIEVERGFDAAELRRLIAALDSGDVGGCLSRPA